MASPPCGSADSKQSFDLLSLAASVSADCAEPILVSSPFTPPIPPPTLRYSSPFRRPGSHARRVLPFHLDSTICARAGKTVISRLNRRTVRLLPRLSACLLTPRKTERTMLTHRPFRLPASRAGGYTHAPMAVQHCGVILHHTLGARKKDVYDTV